MLVWLHDIRNVQHQFICADIHHGTSATTSSHCLMLQTAESFISIENGKWVQHLKHPAEVFALNFRAYIATLLPVLKCQKDYQTTDGTSFCNFLVTRFQGSFP